MGGRGKDASLFAPALPGWRRRGWLDLEPSPRIFCCPTLPSRGRSQRLFSAPQPLRNSHLARDRPSLIVEPRTLAAVGRQKMPPNGSRFRSTGFRVACARSPATPTARSSEPAGRKCRFRDQGSTGDSGVRPWKRSRRATQPIEFQEPRCCTSFDSQTNSLRQREDRRSCPGPRTGSAH